MAQNIRPKYEVHQIDEKVSHKKYSFGENKEIISEEIEEDFGYMVYFPNGSSIRVRTDAELKRLGFDKPATLVDMDTGDEVGEAPTDSLKRRSEQKTVKKGLPSEKTEISNV